MGRASRTANPAIDYRIVLLDPDTGRRWDRIVDGDDRADAIHEARRTFATHFVAYDDFARESDYMDALVRIGRRFDLVACINVASSPAKGFDPIRLSSDFDRCGEPQAIAAPERVLTGRPNASKPLLVVVHPGSLIGSYAMHFEGDDERRLTEPKSLRAAIAAEIRGWRGDLALVAGDLVDELARPEARYLASALDRICRKGVVLCAAPFENDLEAAAGWLARHLAAAARPEVVLTGAWADATDGCISTMARVLAEAGARVRISPLAPWLDTPPRFPLASAAV